ncbi:MAG: hypothetical protein U0172_13270 [Nitrospiraceae bacterium]
MVSHASHVIRRNAATVAVVPLALMFCAVVAPSSWAIDVKLSMDEAKKALAAGREPMDKANTEDEVKKVMQHASMATRVGADPEKDACGTSAILRTKRFWLESFGRKEATESKKQKSDVRMPDDKIQKYLDMPNLEVEVQLCGDDEYFAEGAKVTMQQKGKNIEPVDVGQAERGRKLELADKSTAYRSRFTARFAYDAFDPNAKTKFLVTQQDGKMSEFDADLSKVK